MAILIILMPKYRFPKIGYQRIFTLSKDQNHSFDLNWAFQMRKFEKLAKIGPRRNLG